MNETAQTLVELLQLRAATSSEKSGYVFLEDGERQETALSFYDLDRRARAIAARLQMIGEPKSRALLMYPSGLEYLAAFFGCLYAGMVAVPAYPPRRNRSLDRIERMLNDSGATFVLGTAQILQDVEKRFNENPELQAARRLSTDTIGTSDAGSWNDPKVTREDIAFLQYTSGSTGHPKGVMVTHANLIENEQLISRAFEHDAVNTIFGWLPLYHDMGLIGNVLQPLYLGGRCVLMTPVDFLKKPIRWLEGISRYGANTSGGPDSAYDLCVRKTTPQQREGLDLSSWSIAYNGSEPVRAGTIESFTQTFEPYGFKRNAFFPCYGLAEATLFVSGGLKSRNPVFREVDGEALGLNIIKQPNGSDDNALRLVSSGRVWPAQGVQIVNPETLELCPTGQVGEILLSGECVAKGYWRQDEATAETFGARVAGTSNGTALRTGDLGFVEDDELFVTGRLKDVIIIRGRNFYPQDIEETVAGAHEALTVGMGAAFSLDSNGAERLAVVNEVERAFWRTLDADEVAAAIRKAVFNEHELQVGSISLLKPGSIPKTTSGKIQRRQCRKRLLAGTLSIVGSSDLEQAGPSDGNGVDQNGEDPSYGRNADSRINEISSDLCAMAAKAMNVKEKAIRTDVALSELGLDSISVFELKAVIEDEYRVTGFAEDTLADSSIDALSKEIVRRMSGSSDQMNEPDAMVAIADFDIFAKCDTDAGYFGKYRLADDKYFTQPVLEGPVGPHMRFDGREVIVWSINDYLGLSGHPRLRTRTDAALKQYGTWSPMGSRLLTGNTHSHMALEERLAVFLKKEASIVFNYGYMGVMGTINSLVGDADTVIIDSLSHACIVDGAILASKAKRFNVFRHNDMNHLEELLARANRDRRGGIFVVTEGVFGMTGDTAVLPEICDLKDQFGARLFIDDAHGFGTMGPTGRGTAEEQNVHDRIDLYFGTFAKSFAAIGGVTAGPKQVVDYIRYNARTNVFAKSLPMVYVNAVDEALSIIEEDHERRAHMWTIARRMQSGLKELGYKLGDTSSPITPVYVPTGSEEIATRAMRFLRTEHGIFVSAVTYPVVPKGVVLFRLTSTAAHSEEDVDKTLEAFDKLKSVIGVETSGGNGQEPDRVTARA